MGVRRIARESALQILFQLEFDSHPLENVLEQYWQNKRASRATMNYANSLTKGIVSRLGEIDDAVQSVSTHWRISRMSLVDRNILRIAVFELMSEENVAPAIIINEAIEIAKKYSNDEAAHFVNGILDAVRKKLRPSKVPCKNK